ncbi:MAG TPA: adenosine deaminase [Thermoanaerobaculia bacterium]|nr:adenosine deaminase [Thermoanaerobaculia bacterium]
MNDLLSGITELHLHLEGSLSIESAIDIAAGRGHRWGRMTASELRRSFRFESLESFLMSVRGMAEVLCSAEALERCAYELSLGLFRKGVEYAEVYCSPYIFVRWGMTYAEVIAAVDRGFTRGEQEGGCFCTILLDTVRQWGLGCAVAVLDGHERFPIPRVIGFGMGGQEKNPMSAFIEIFARARDLGLHTVTHAGESSSADDVRDAVELLAVERVAHGIRAVDDPVLLAELVSKQIPLDLAITSNYRTMSVKGSHPIRQLLDAGIRVTLSTDDPALFRTDLSREYRRAGRLCGISREELAVIAGNGIDASFAPASLKERLHKRLAERVERSAAAV